MLNLYFVALIVPYPFQSVINDFRKEIVEKYNCRHALKTVPHITLQPPFKTKAGSEEILKCLSSLSETTHPFSVSTTGFDSFDERVAFIAVELNDELKNLQQRVNQLLSEQKLAPVNNRAFHPHITLVHRDLNPVILPELRSMAGQKEIIRTITMNAVTLLIHQNRQWQNAGEIRLA